MKTPFELGISDNDASLESVTGSLSIGGEAKILHLSSLSSSSCLIAQPIADDIAHLFEGNVDIVLTLISFSGGGENGFRELRAFGQTGRERQAADSLSPLVLGPGGSR